MEVYMCSKFAVRTLKLCIVLGRYQKVRVSVREKDRVRAACDLFNKSWLYLRKKITGSTPRALKNNFRFLWMIPGHMRGEVIFTYDSQSFLKTLLEHVLLDIQVLFPKANDFYLVLPLPPNFFLHKPCLAPLFSLPQFLLLISYPTKQKVAQPWALLRQCFSFN